MESQMTKRTAENVSERPAVAPHVDVYENEKEILVVADLPGVSKDELRVDVEQDQVTLEGRWSPPPGGTPLAAEFGRADYRRSFVLPQGIDRDKIGAELRGGILSLHLPKSEALKPRRIAVRSG
jgi:HSP20 family protein